jgi:hypothetical protein
MTLSYLPARKSLMISLFTVFVDAASVVRGL